MLMMVFMAPSIIILWFIVQIPLGATMCGIGM